MKMETVLQQALRFTILPQRIDLLQQLIRTRQADNIVVNDDSITVNGVRITPRTGQELITQLFSELNRKPDEIEMLSNIKITRLYRLISDYWFARYTSYRARLMVSITMSHYFSGHIPLDKIVVKNGVIQDMYVDQWRYTSLDVQPSSIPSSARTNSSQRPTRRTGNKR